MHGIINEKLILTKIISQPHWMSEKLKPPLSINENRECNNNKPLKCQ